MNEGVLNKVKQSGLITLDLKDYFPLKEEYVIFDIADFLFEKLILKEKDFRQALKGLDYSKYQNKYVGIYCSEDVVIPKWAYLLATVHLHPYARAIYFGNEKEVVQKILRSKIECIDINLFKDKIITIKGCSDVEVDMDIYVLLIQKLIKVARKIMYGEPCGAVPLYKSY